MYLVLIQTEYVLYSVHVLGDSNDVKSKVQVDRRSGNSEMEDDNLDGCDLEVI